MDNISPTRMKIIIEAQNKSDRAFLSVKKDLAKIDKQAKITSNAVVRGFDKMGTKAEAYAKKMQHTSDAFRKMRNVGVVTFGALTFGMKQMIDVSVSFESAFAGVKKTIEATDKEFKALDKDFQSMTEKMPIAYEELSRIAEIGGQLGVGIKDIKEFTKQVAMISETTNLTAEDASKSFARISNIMGEPLSNLDKMASAVVDLGNNFATSESEIVHFTGKIAGAGKIGKLATSDLFAISTALTSVGVEAEAGGTAVSKAILKMNTEVAKFSAMGEVSEDLKKFAEVSGMTSEDFAKHWKEKPIDAFNAFVVGIKDAGDMGVTVLQDVMGKDVRLTRAFLSLSNAGDLLSKSVDKSSKAWKENIAMVNEANKRFATTESQMERTKAGFRNMSDAVGDALVPVLLDMVETMKPVIKSITEWVREHPRMTKYILIGTTALAGLVAVMGTIGLTMIALGPVFAVLGTAFGALGGVIMALMSPIGLVIGAIALWIIYWDEIKGGMGVVWEYMKQFGEWLVGIFKADIEALTLGFEIWKIGMMAIGDFLMGVFMSVLQATKGAIEWLGNAISKIAGIIKNVALVAVNFLTNGFARLKDGIGRAVDYIKNTAYSVFDAITEKINKVINAIKKAIDWLRKLKDKASSAVEKGKSNLQANIENPGAMWDTIKSNVASHFANGGMVNAPIGQAVPAILHGGEEVIS